MHTRKGAHAHRFFINPWRPLYTIDESPVENLKVDWWPTKCGEPKIVCPEKDIDEARCGIRLGWRVAVRVAVGRVALSAH